MLCTRAVYVEEQRRMGVATGQRAQVDTLETPLLNVEVCVLWGQPLQGERSWSLYVVCLMPESFRESEIDFL